MTEDNAEGLQVGLAIHTSDGEQIGRVKRIDGRAFAVDAPRAFDYWLPRSAVAAVQADAILLRFKWQELDFYKMVAPDDFRRDADAEESDQHI
jgi:hypothetical protein